MMSEKRQKLLVTSLLFVLVVLTAQLWLSNWVRDDVASHSVSVDLPKVQWKSQEHTPASDVSFKAETVNTRWNQTNYSSSLSVPVSASPNTSEPALNFQLQSVSFENGQWKARITNTFHQVFEVIPGAEIAGLGKVLEVNNQHVLFQSAHLKTDIGFAHFKQEMITASANMVAVPPSVSDVTEQ